jgi:hypothetical protein
MSLIYLGFLSLVNPMSVLLILHVAMQMGLYLHQQTVGVWRVVSEDSDDPASVFPADWLHQLDFHLSSARGLVPLDTQLFQHIAKFY